uniref:Nodule-specific cysteine-rich peptide G31 n=1 Tax=Pisum sativum TaxID=3888 RepID=A0A7T8DV51_PEA|nr:nodule-specific cysteine-rich peptide G31 [Pisum sativum]
MSFFAFIIFFFLFFVVTNSDPKIPCIKDDDCPKVEFPRYILCINKFCENMPLALVTTPLVENDVVGR